MVLTNRRTVLEVLVAGGATLGGASPVSASPDRCTLDWRKELSRRKPGGSPTINVTQAVVNDIDSGYDGNYWAYDDYRRTIQVWEVGADVYQAVAMYNGQFDGVEGQESPGSDDVSTDVLSGDEDGTLHGGYAATIEGELLENPDWSTRGFVGTFDYEGDVEAGTRPGAVDWSVVYFGSDRGFSFDWWGWIYEGGDCGTWVNARSGGCGDILCD